MTKSPHEMLYVHVGIDFYTHQVFFEKYYFMSFIMGFYLNRMKDKLLVS